MAREVVSQVNGCADCHADQTVTGGMTPEQSPQIRAGRIMFNPKPNIFASLTGDIAQHRGKGNATLVQAGLDGGWSPETLVDMIVTIGDKTVTNYLHAVTQVPIDFPAAPALTIAIAAE